MLGSPLPTIQCRGAASVAMSERTSQITPVIVSEAGVKPVAIAGCYAREKQTQVGTSQVKTIVAAGTVQGPGGYAFPSHEMDK